MGNDWLGRIWAGAWASDIKWTDNAIAVFAFGQVWIGLRQAIIARRQTEIADQTREIAVAALGRPYVFFLFVSHNLEEWRAGKDQLRFVFRLVNHGNSVAMIRRIYGYVALSSREGRVEKELKLIQHFPERDKLLLTIGPWGNVFHASDGGKLLEPWRDERQLFLKPGETSANLASQLPFPPLDASGSEIEREVHELTGRDGPLSPWLFGHVSYQAPLGTYHHTNFCIYGLSDGRFGEHEEAPYTERT